MDQNDDDLLRVLIIAPSLDGNDVGEVYSAFQGIKALTRKADVTVLSSSREGAVPLAEQLPEAKVITWPELPLLYRKFERFNAQAKPGLILFHRQVRNWVRNALASGTRFDIVHQYLPQAMRHGFALRGMGLPYVIGPLGGGLETPPKFKDEVGPESLATRLRAIDGFRLRHDPWLKASYQQADLILGVAPYVGDRLKTLGIKRFHAMLERGHGALPPENIRQANIGQLNLLHVGRTVRTKGLRDVVRAMAHLRDLPDVTLTSAGDGPDLAACRAEAHRLGVADRIAFLGRIPREAVEDEYTRADVFCFPSYREPMGGVFFEAMAHGLPVLTAARGGPDFIIDDDSGIRLAVETPEQFATDIADAIRSLALDPARRLALGAGARTRLKSFGNWEDKASSMIALYREVLNSRVRSMSPRITSGAASSRPARPALTK